jgi:hypothetical protein
LIMNLLIEHIPAHIIGKLVWIGFTAVFLFFLATIFVACTAFALWLKDKLRE